MAYVHHQFATRLTPFQKPALLRLTVVQITATKPINATELPLQRKY